MGIKKIILLILIFNFSCKPELKEEELKYLPEQKSKKELHIDSKLNEIENYYRYRKNIWLSINAKQYFIDQKMAITINGKEITDYSEFIKFYDNSTEETIDNFDLKFKTEENEEKYIGELEKYFEELNKNIPKYDYNLLSNKFDETITEDDRYFYMSGVPIDKYDIENINVIKYFAGERQEIVDSKGFNQSMFYRLWPAGKPIKYMISPLLDRSKNKNSVIAINIGQALKIWSDGCKNLFNFKYSEYNAKNCTDYAFRWKHFNGTLFTKSAGSMFSYNIPIAYSLHSKVKINEDSKNSTIVHEIGHLLGLTHEHQRPDRDKYIEKTPYWKDIPFNMQKFSHSYSTMTKEYDYISVMHYADVYDKGTQHIQKLYYRKNLTGIIDNPILIQESIERKKDILESEIPTDIDLRFLCQIYGKYDWKSGNPIPRIINFENKNYYYKGASNKFSKDINGNKILPSDFKIVKGIDYLASTYKYEKNPKEFIFNGEILLTKMEKLSIFFIKEFGQEFYWGEDSSNINRYFNEEIALVPSFGKNSIYVKTISEDSKNSVIYTFNIPIYYPIAKTILIKNSDAGEILFNKNYSEDETINVSGFSGDNILLRVGLDDSMYQILQFSNDGISFNNVYGDISVSGFSSNALTKRYLKVKLDRAKINAGILDEDKKLKEDKEKIYVLNFYKINEHIIPEKFIFKNMSDSIVKELNPIELSGENIVKTNNDQLNGSKVKVAIIKKTGQDIAYGFTAGIIDNVYNDNIVMNLQEGDNSLFVKIENGGMYFVYKFNIKYSPMLNLTIKLDNSGSFIFGGNSYKTTKTFKVPKGENFEFEVPSIIAFNTKICRNLVNYNKTPQSVNEVRYLGDNRYEYKNITKNDEFFIDYVPEGFDSIEGWVTVAPNNGKNFYKFKLKSDNRYGVSFINGYMYFLRGKENIISAYIEKIEQMAGWQYALCITFASRKEYYLKGYGGGNNGFKTENILLNNFSTRATPAFDYIIGFCFYEYGIAGEDNRKKEYYASSPIFVVFVGSN